MFGLRFLVHGNCHYDLKQADGGRKLITEYQNLTS